VTESINPDTTEKLQELLESIASGINKTEEILAQSQQVEASVAQYRQDVLAAVQEIGGQETLTALRAQLAEARMGFDEPASIEADQRIKTLETKFGSWETAIEGSLAQLHKDANLFFRLTQHIERRAYEVSQAQADVEQAASTVDSTVSQIGGLDALESLQKEHVGLLAALEQFKSAHETEVRIEEKIAFVQEQVNSVNSMVSAAKSELVQQAMALVQQIQASAKTPDLNQALSRLTQDIREEHQAIDTENKKKIRSLETKLQTVVGWLQAVSAGVAISVILFVVVLIIKK
jgi:chromosome segregation ATPase